MNSLENEELDDLQIPDTPPNTPNTYAGVKVKRQMSQKQMDNFKKAQAKRLENIALRKAEKQQLTAERDEQRNQKILMKAQRIERVYKRAEKQMGLDDIRDEELPVSKTVKRRGKKVLLVEEESESEDEEVPLIVRRSSVTSKKPVAQTYIKNLKNSREVNLPPQTHCPAIVWC